LVFFHRSSAARVAMPTSKFRPLLEKCALSIQRVYLNANPPNTLASEWARKRR
jgi:hypothetical protein